MRALVATGAVTLYAAAHESDKWFESVFFEDAYKWLVGLPVAISVLIVAYRDRGTLIDETMRIAQKPAATLFAVGGIYVCFFCQMLDRPHFWTESGLSGNVVLQKSMVEESAELFAYMLIAFSGVEAMIAALQDRAAVLRAAAFSAEATEMRPSRSLRATVR